MTTYVAMLRGINVSGRNKLAMDDLRALVVDAGGKDVATYIQSGNAVFTSRRSSPTLVASLESGLERLLGSRVPVVVRTKAELDTVIVTNPFIARGEDPSVLHVTFMGSVPDSGTVASASAAAPATDDEFHVVGRHVYLFCPHGYGTTKLTNAWFERRFKSEATTRNWKTVTRLVDMTRERSERA